MLWKSKLGVAGEVVGIGEYLPDIPDCIMAVL